MIWLERVLQWFLSGVLLATGIGKLLDVPGFIRVIDSYHVFPQSVQPLVAAGMVVTELRLAEALMRPSTRRPAALFSVLLHVCFTLWAVLALLRGLDIPNCGCFGVFWARPLTWGTVGEDVFMVLVSGGLWWAVSKRLRS